MAGHDVIRKRRITLFFQMILAVIAISSRTALEQDVNARKVTMVTGSVVTVCNIAYISRCYMSWMRQAYPREPTATAQVTSLILFFPRKRLSSEPMQEFWEMCWGRRELWLRLSCRLHWTSLSRWAALTETRSKPGFAVFPNSPA